MVPYLLLAAVALLIVLAIALKTRWIEPSRRLAGVAERMAAGDWAARADVEGATDLRALAGRLNLLAAAAQKGMSALDHQRSDLQQLVDSLPDPILLADSSQRVILLSAAASKILQLSAAEALGKKFINVVNDAQILELFESLQSSQMQQRDIRIMRAGQKHYYQAVGTRTRAGGVLIVLRNVTTMASAIQMKTDFVANASHELRTPLAAIKIAFETLNEVYEEDPATTRKCIEIIDGHIHRLEEMLRDLLDLSRVETPDLRAQVSEVSVASLFAAVQHGLGSMARQKQVEIVFEGDESLTFKSDQKLLDLTLKNLVENSIKYTPANGRVTISIARDEGGIEMRIIDTGIGIPPEHLERVFERFYQVDAARTGGSARGTGLGLAIVKHAVLALGGTVDLQSEPGKGTTAICRVPDLSVDAAS